MLTGQHTPRSHKYIQVNINREEIKQPKPLRRTLQGVRGGGTNLTVRVGWGS